MVGVLSNNLDQTNWQFFGSDEIKVTPRLTVTLGMRWQPDLHFTEASGKESSFRPGLQSAVFPNAPLGLLFKGDSQLPSNVLSPNWHNVAPRISFAYDLFGTGKTAAGYGIFYDDFASIRLNRFRSFNRTSSTPPSLTSLWRTRTSARARIRSFRRRRPNRKRLTSSSVRPRLHRSTPISGPPTPSSGISISSKCCLSKPSSLWRM